MNGQAASVKPRILVAPLDWGLGHATRCVPVINELMAQGAEVLLAGDGKIQTLLQAEFPQLQLLPLKGYGIKYGKNRWDTIGRLLLQIPQIIEAMDDEHDWLHRMIDEHKIDAVISDNRYGLFNERIPSVFITHQLLIKTSAGNTADGLLQKLNYEYIHAFNQCWVPDAAGAENLAGTLSHPDKMPSIPVHYLGTLSRFQKQQNTITEKHLLIVLSGPEPQRTLLEETLLDQLAYYKEPVLLVRGLPGTTDTISAANSVLVKNHLSATDLQTAIEEANYVVSRCGYSTVMDLMVLQKKAILIPTPGQTEQEYLADHLMDRCMAFCIPQEKFRLRSALDLAGSFPYQFLPQPHSALSEAVRGLLDLVKPRQ